MNLVQDDCPEGMGKDVLFRITTNLSTIPCEPRAAFYVVVSIVLFLQMCVLILLLTSIIFLPRNVKNTHGHLATCFVYVSISCVISWLSLTRSDFYSGTTGSAPLSMFGATVSIYLAAASAHYRKMSELSSKFLGGNAASYTSNVLAAGIQKAIGNNTWLDKALFGLACVMCGCLFVLLCIVLPAFPMPEKEPWYVSGNLYARDFIVSLALWCVIILSSALVITSLMVLWRIWLYLGDHIDAQKRNSKSEIPVDWVERLTTLKFKIGWTAVFSLLGFITGISLVASMSVESGLGVRWWGCYIIFFISLLMSTFLLSISFPSNEVRKLLGLPSLANGSRTAPASEREASKDKNLPKRGISSTYNKSGTLDIAPAQQPTPAF